MEIALALVVLAAAVLALTAVAGKWGLSAPLLLITAGIVASFVPGIPEVVLHEEVVLVGLLPPLLYSAALQTSLVDFNANRRPILLLSVGLVVFTTFGVGAVVHALLDVSWPAALAIGAVVAPPDAVAATAIGRKIGLPRRIVTILEGESLLNDATALVALRTAVLALAGSVSILHIGVDFVRAAGGGVLIGFACFLLIAWVRRRVSDPLLDTAISLVVPFAAYVAAEEVHASGVLSVVVAGLLLGHKAPILQTAQSRIAERMNWRTIAYVLENTVFLLIGLQARWIVDDVSAGGLGWGRVIVVCAAALVAVIVLRLVWMAAVRVSLLRSTAGNAPWGYTLLVGWAGMRGVVTLAAAFVIPEETEYREVLLLIAFTVVAGTLFLQGTTLPWLARRLDVPSPDPAQDALARATLLHQVTEVSLEKLRSGLSDEEHLEHQDTIELIRTRLEQRNFAIWEQLGSMDGETPSAAYARLRLEMINTERAKVLEVRSTGTVPAEVVSQVLAMLDVEESMLDFATFDAEAGNAQRSTGPVGELCTDLREARDATPQTPGECADCLAEGTRWVHLRICDACGQVGCCDSSTARHATAHFRATGHPVMRSGEPGEDWRWCFLHNLTG